MKKFIFPPLPSWAKAEDEMCAGNIRIQLRIQKPSQGSSEGGHGRQGDVVVLAKVKGPPYQIPEAKVTTVILREGGLRSNTLAPLDPIPSFHQCMLVSNLTGS